MNSLNNLNDLMSLSMWGGFSEAYTRVDPTFEIGTVLNLYYHAVTGRFYTQAEQEKLLSLLMHMIAPVSERDKAELIRLTREYTPDSITPMELKNLRLMFRLSEKKPEAEAIIVNAMLYVLDLQKKQDRLFCTRVEWLRALQLAREDTVEVLYDRACIAYVTGKMNAAAGLFERAASKSLDTDLWRLAGCALSEIGQNENAYSALYRYAYWNDRAALPIPEAVTSQLDALAEILGEETCAALRGRVESDADKTVRRQIGF